MKEGSGSRDFAKSETEQFPVKGSSYKSWGYMARQLSRGWELRRLECRASKTRAGMEKIFDRLSRTEVLLLRGSDNVSDLVASGCWSLGEKAGR